ncbi:BPSL0761 family protein [Pseudomonas mohnii]
MALPYERTRSVIQAEEFLRELSKNAELPDAIRNEARRLLRHYPTADQIMELGRFEELLAATKPDDAAREMAIGLHVRMFSSSFEH